MCELNRKYLETEKESQQLLVLLPAPSPPHCPHCCHSLPFSEPASPSKPRMASGHNQAVHSILTTKPPSFKFDITIIQNVYFVYRIYFNVLSSLQVAPAKCSLCSRGLRWSPPITPLSLSVASRQYNPQTKVWYFSIDDHDLLLRKSRGLAPGLIVTPLPTWVSDAFRRPICTHQH